MTGSAVENRYAHHSPNPSDAHNPEAKARKAQGKAQDKAQDTHNSEISWSWVSHLSGFVPFRSLPEKWVSRAVPTQAKAAIKILAEAELIAVAVPCVCELVWVLRKVYGVQTPEIATAIRALHATAKVEMNRPAVEAGLAILDAGGDFADGGIA